MTSPRWFPVLAVAVSAAALLSGCTTTCQPKLDVRHCGPGSIGCEPRDSDKVVDWNPDLDSVFPDVARFLKETPVDMHSHTDWTADQERAWWTFWDVPMETPDKQIFVRHDGELFRVRVLAC